MFNIQGQRKTSGMVTVSSNISKQGIFAKLFLPQFLFFKYMDKKWREIFVVCAWPFLSAQGLKHLQIKQRPSAFRPWSPRVPSNERPAPSHKHVRYVYVS